MGPRFDRGSKKDLQRDGDAGLFSLWRPLRLLGRCERMLGELSDLSAWSTGAFGEKVS
jgi:hypothetical protein